MDCSYDVENERDVEMPVVTIFELVVDIAREYVDIDIISPVQVWDKLVVDKSLGDVELLLYDSVGKEEGNYESKPVSFIILSLVIVGHSRPGEGFEQVRLSTLLVSLP
jgi:hypothetical protein